MFIDDQVRSVGLSNRHFDLRAYWFRITRQ
jgi:hypothetical protein